MNKIKRIAKKVTRYFWGWRVWVSDRVREKRHARRKQRGLVPEEVTLQIHDSYHW